MIVCLWSEEVRVHLPFCEWANQLVPQQTESAFSCAASAAHYLTNYGGNVNEKTMDVFTAHTLHGAVAFAGTVFQHKCRYLLCKWEIIPQQQL